MALLDQFDGDVPDYIETETEPLVCIHCGENTDKVNWGAPEAYHGFIQRDNECMTCGTYWEEQYDMALITNIKIGDKL